MRAKQRDRSAKQNDQKSGPISSIYYPLMCTVCGKISLSLKKQQPNSSLYSSVNLWALNSSSSDIQHCWHIRNNIVDPAWGNQRNSIRCEKRSVSSRRFCSIPEAWDLASLVLQWLQHQSKTSIRRNGGELSSWGQEFLKEVESDWGRRDMKRKMAPSSITYDFFLLAHMTM